jgi:hypothetical protein
MVTRSGGRALAWAFALLVAGAGTARAAALDQLVARVTQAGMQERLEALVGERVTPEQQAATSAYLQAELTACGYAVATEPVDDSENVIASLPGALTPEQVFLVGAHFDTVEGTPGADDDASGVAAMLEIACALADESPRSTIQFVGFALEEPGLVGSTRFALDASLAGRQIAGMISLEMIGYTCAEPLCQANFFDIPPCLDVSEEFVNTGLHIAVVGNTSSTAWKDAFVAAAAEAVPDLPVLWGLVAGAGECLPDSRRSDHAPFWDHGYPALLVTDTANFRNQNYHQPSDTLDTLDLPFATRVAQATLATVALQAGVVPEPDAGAAAALVALVLLRRRRGGRAAKRVAVAGADARHAAAARRSSS